MITKKTNKNNLIDEIEKRENKKNQNLEYFKMVNEINSLNISKKTKLRIRDCGTFLQFICDVDHYKHKLVGSNFCENRFCPHCSYNKARKDAYQTTIIVNKLKENGYKFIFLTLTAPNVSDKNLEQELINYTDSFKRLFELKDVKKIVKGYIRKLEVTYNKERGDYHPHYHVLIAVDKSYFNNSKNYISQKKWLELWRESKRDESITQVDVRKFKENERDTAIFELTKYLSKDSNYLFSKSVFEVFYKALKGKREFSYNGEFKKARKMLKDGELDYLKTKDDAEYFYKMWFLWNGTVYKNNLHEMLTDDELKTYNVIYKKDMDID